jgi:polar amino acid transport system substrate-binding protein
MKKIISWITMLCLCFSFALLACGTSNETGGNSNDKSGDAGGGKSKFELVKDGKFTFAASGEYKPFSFMKDGKMVGYDIAVGEAIAKKLGLDPVQKKAKFASIVLGVQKHRYDAAVASHTITKDRLEHVNFSIPYYYSGPQIFTRPGSDIKTVADLKGKEIAVSRGSTYAKLAQKYTDKIKQYDSDVVALQALAKGHHDVVITDAITGQKEIKAGVKIEGHDMLGTSKQAVAVPKDRPKLLKAINKAIQELKEDGTLAKLGEKWIGKDISQPSNNQ